MKSSPKSRVYSKNAHDTCIQAVRYRWTGATERGLLLKKKAFLEVKLEPFFVLVSKGCFVIKRAKSFPAPPPSYKC